MVQPSPVLLARVRFTTKQVGFGFYRGNQTGSVGAHTQYGGYLVDWRKVRNYAVPDLKNFNLTPYVTKEIEYRAEPRNAVDKMKIPEAYKSNLLIRRALPFLASWRASNHDEFTDLVKRQHIPMEPTMDTKPRVVDEQGAAINAAIQKETERLLEEAAMGTETERLLAETSETEQGLEFPNTTARVNTQAERQRIPILTRREKAEARFEAEAERFPGLTRDQIDVVKSRAGAEVHRAQQKFKNEEAAEEKRIKAQEAEEAKKAEVKKIEETRRAIEAAMKNTPREYQVGKIEKQKRSQSKALRKFIKKRDEQHKGLTPEIRHTKLRDQAGHQQIEEAKRLKALEKAFRGPARQMAKKLSI